jgi:DNA-binding NarL/FixJ family response regulator
VKTVELHLRTIFRKVDAGSWVEVCPVMEKADAS